MPQLVCAVGAETDLIMCAENRWPTLRLEMQLPMRDLSYPPGQSKSARVINTALASTVEALCEQHLRPEAMAHARKYPVRVIRPVFESANEEAEYLERLGQWK